MAGALPQLILVGVLILLNAVRTRMLDIATFPDTAKALAVLRSMQNARTQMAVIINEHGASEGIVTIEDLVEELVGEIYDETDRDLLSVRHRADGTIELPGRFPLHDLVDLGIEMPPGDSATIAGLVLERLGRIPTVVPERVDIGGWTVTVTGLHRRAITSVTLEPRRGGPDQPDPDPG